MAQQEQQGRKDSPAAAPQPPPRKVLWVQIDNEVVLHGLQNPQTGTSSSTYRPRPSVRSDGGELVDPGLRIERLGGGVFLDYAVKDPTTKKWKRVCVEVPMSKCVVGLEPAGDL